MSLNADTLKNNIQTEANTVTITVKTIDNNGQVHEDSTVHPFESTDGKVMNYDGQHLSGFELLIKIISQEVIKHLEANIKTSLLERFDNLEMDFNTFTTAMAGVGVGPATAVPAAVAAWLATSNTVTRATQKITSQTESLDKPYLFGNKTL